MGEKTGRLKRPGQRRPRVLGLVTVGRSDLGYAIPVLRRILGEPGLEPRLYVSGMHLAPEFGLTVQEIEQRGFPIAARIPIPLGNDSPLCMARAMAEGVSGFAQLFAQSRPDLLVVFGDRFDMFPAALAALPFRIPVAHIGGGELTEGAIDDALRHAMTKLSHLHFVETKEYARRVLQLGEEPWRVHTVGNPSLDNLRGFRPMTASEFGRRAGLPATGPFLLVTFHSATLEMEHSGEQAGELLAALEAIAMPVLFTMPNADPGGHAILERVREYVAGHPDAKLIDNLGTDVYFSAMSLAAAMVGNSSSGIVEAASFKLPVVNIGNRQKGRPRTANIIDVGYRRHAILRAVRKALSPRFRGSLRHLRNPFGDGHSAEHIVRKLATVEIDDRLLIKRFRDLGAAAKP